MNTALLVPESDADARWRHWQQRGARQDRRQAKQAARVFVLVALGLLVALFVQLF